MKPLFAKLLLILSMLLAACQNTPQKNSTQQLIDQQMQQANAARTPASLPSVVNQALLQGGQVPAANKPAEPRFNIAVNNAPAAQVFAAIASDSKYNIIVHPDVSGNLTLNLKNVTLLEALDAIRDTYGYDYQIKSQHISINPAGLQARLFQINYLSANRVGHSGTRVISGSIVSNTSSNSSSGASSGAGGETTNTAEGASVLTDSRTNFWTELADTLRVIIGNGDGRSVVASPQSGVIVVRAMPGELAAVERFLRISQINIERSVMLEAKIVEVVLNDGYQNGINWVALASNRNARIGTGVDPNQLTIPSGNIGNAGAISQVYDSDLDALVANSLGNVIATPILGSINGMIPNSPLGGVLGLSFTTSSFNAILSFLETQGSIHVISSPRIATINNQKAVLKVGNDDYFVTNITTTTATSGTGTTVSPTINLQAFFSGISLDVLPQIDDQDNIMLHIRPSVSVVTERNKQINLGTAGTFNLPLASSRTNETDSIVRVREGNIVAIGGLMEQAQTNDSAKVPGAGEVPIVGELFKQGKRALQKRELVVLLKATIIRSDQEWRQDLQATTDRLNRLKQEPLGPRFGEPSK